MSRNLKFYVIHSWLWMLLFVFPLNGNWLSGVNPCQSKSTCGECIQNPSCGWCLQPLDRFQGVDRCFQPTGLASSGFSCPEEYIYQPMNVIQFESMPDPSREITLSPQKVKAQLVVGKFYSPKIDEIIKADPYSGSSRHMHVSCTVDDSNVPPLIELTDNSTDYVDIMYYSKCSNETGPEISTNKCTGIKDRIQFKIEMKLKTCPKDPQEFSEIIAISVKGTNAVSTIDLSMLCSCPCEKPDSPGYKELAPECSDVGTYKCGICECNPSSMGRRCECISDTSLNQDDPRGCKPPGSTETVECSGKGTCVCNQCECEARENVNETISGKWCECDNFSCYRHGGEICGGHGRCDCGECKCEAPWTGKACECYNATNTCFPPFKENPQLCDGHGDCICGVCQCQVTAEGRYTGRYCERCPHCTETCEELKPCVLCQMYHVGPYDDDTCVKTCGNFTPTKVQVVQVNEEDDEFICTGYDEYDCKYAFVYRPIYRNYNEIHFTVDAQQERECPSDSSFALHK